MPGGVGDRHLGVREEGRGGAGQAAGPGVAVVGIAANHGPQVAIANHRLHLKGTYQSRLTENQHKGETLYRNIYLSFFIYVHI